MKFIVIGICLFTTVVTLSQDNSAAYPEQLYGVWHIDSSAESGILNNRKAVNDEFFVFKENGMLYIERMEDGNKNSFLLGKYELDSDTLKIETKKGTPGMNFIIKMHEGGVQLNGTFAISELNDRNPTLFLSRERPHRIGQVASVYCSGDQLVYRNIENEIIINPLEQGAVVDCPNCDTLYRSGMSLNRFFLKPGNGKLSEIIISDSTRSPIEEKHQLKNSYLPDPVLFYGASINATKCSIKAKHLFAMYPPQMNINLKADVVSWKMYIGSKEFVGTGNELSEEVLVYLEDYSGVEVISIIADVRTADGIIRKIGGVYSL